MALDEMVGGALPGRRGQGMSLPILEASKLLRQNQPLQFNQTRKALPRSLSSGSMPQNLPSSLRSRLSPITR
jgi:hypothetical protein